MADEEIDCACCGRSGRYYARGLLSGCYNRFRKYQPGMLDRYPLRGKQRRGTLLDRWAVLACRPPLGTTTDEIARQLDVSPSALRRMLGRARHDGDRRAIYLPHPRTGQRYRKPQDR